MLRSKNKTTGAATEPTFAEINEKQTPYAGSIDGVPVETAPHVLVSGPTGRGKTTRILSMGAVQWVGPRVIVSSKTDLLKWIVKKGIAGRGPLFVMDLAGELDPSFNWLQGVDYQMVTSDPTSLIANDDDALAMASLLMKVGSLGASDGGDSGSGDDAFWQTQAAQPLAALLLAGKASGKGIAWTVRAASKTVKDDENDDSPSWANAYELVEKNSFHAESLNAVVDMEAKLRDSVIATMKAGLAPWLLTNVRGQRGSVPFAPSMLEGPSEPTLAIIAPSDGVAAGAAVGAIETVIRHWRRGVEHGLPRVLLSIDEAVNTAAIPKLPTYITEGRGLGVACVIAVQSTNQMELRWGSVGAKVLREVFPAFLILDGAPEFEALELAEKWSGEHDVWRETINADQTRTMTAEKAPRRTVSEMLPGSVEEGRLLLYGKEGKLVQLPGIWNLPDAA
ncbi:type IV secretory system conjugative DNA transfer family protein [Brevibacterium linens]|uniref:TraM recognition site of TraD and TraG n=1 Tax=Brevibacterium linens TaxID=1703 RepID=A0A2H1KH69_BRELN|nr:TraM recognition domain-containing protein [Brevibacterium linens]SMX99076.1 TraM recognition site of TraD and TraG [Brevibacterium linens]